jgi:ribonuclease R
LSTKQKAKTQSLRLSDPKLEREKTSYDNPLPSREFIIQVLETEGIPLAESRLLELLDIAPDETETFARRLAAMERDGQIMRNRKGALCVVAKLDLINGRVQGHPDGFGFLIPDDKSPDLFLGPKEMNKVLHGDRVIGREIGLDRRGRREGAIVEVLESTNRKIVGRLHEEHGIYYVVAEEKRISQDILVPPAELGGAKPGQVVIAEIVAQPSRHAEPIAHVIEVLGNYADPGMEIEIALRKHDLPHVFSKDVQKLAAKLPTEVRKTDLKGREDLRHLPLVTIDGETARDFDDAVYCEPLLPPFEKGVRKGDFRLIVAIADVSHYVKPGDALDQESRERGTSVYFPRRVIPMLPEELSNGLCSLNPEVDRLCMVCDMAVSAKGEVKHYKFYPAVMHSHARLTYTLVAAMLYEQDAAARAQYAALLPQLENLNKVFRALLKARELRGAVDFDSQETQMIFNQEGKIDRIVPVKRNDAHRLIEECMLAANVSAADFLESRHHATLYRIHEGPTPEKLERLRDFLRGFGLDLGGGDEPHPKDYAKLRDRIKDRPDAALLQTVMLRSMQQAVYSPDNVGHFGLAYPAYAHFTSPIRRYPDLLVHRSIKAVLAGGQYSPGNWDEVGVHCSQTERRADEATRDVEAWLKCYYMQDKVGETFMGTIAAVTSFGIFVALDDIFIEGLAHISELGSDYFHFDAGRHELLGERTRSSFRLGDRLPVTVARVDMETSKIDFVLTAAATGVPAAPSAAGVAKPRDIEKREKSAASLFEKDDRRAKLAHDQQAVTSRAQDKTWHGQAKSRKARRSS